MYAPLYIKTDNSLQTSMIKLDELIDFSIKNDIKALTITDNNMYGVMDFYKKCKNHSIKPIIGLEVSINDMIVVLYAKNYNGYKNLIKLSTISKEDNLTLKSLIDYKSDLICIIPFSSLNLYDMLDKEFNDIYKGYSDKKQIDKLGKWIYFKPSLYIEKSDKNYIKYLQAIKEGVTIDNITVDEMDSYILTEYEYSKEYGQSIVYLNEIVNMCNVEIPFKLDITPKYELDNTDSYTYLKKKCIEGLKKRFGNSVKSIYQDRLKYELSVINKMGFCDYFLIVSDYVNWAKNNDIIVGTGRGSAVGSLVAYCLMITDVDPLKYNLLFERFLNPERVSMPDIDIDFEHSRREDVINYCINKYGEKRVAPIITFGTMGAKQAIRDVGRAMDINPSIIDSLSKLIDSKMSLKDNYNTNLKLKELLARKKELMTLYKVSLKLEGLKRHTSMHAAGIVMSRIDLDEVIPLDKSHGFYVTGYDMTYLEEIGLLKMDFLAIKYLTTIHDIISSINKDYNTNIKFDDIPLNDSNALQIFYDANTLGIFQFESDGMINFLKKLKVTSMNDLFAAIALFRPGPMKNIPTFIARKQGKEKVNYIHSSLKDVLKDTYGIIVYQEQIMQIAHVMSDYSLGEADILRKAMSKKKKDILLKEEEKFKSRALKKGYNESTINSVYSLMMKFAEYGFNKSHSIGYSIVAYKMAYLKAYYPKNFIAYLLTQELNDPVKTKKYIYEAKKYGINILNPDINLSTNKYIIEQLGIRYPINNIKNVGTQTAEYILKRRSESKFTSIYDFISRCYSKSVNRKALESLIYAGVFKHFGYNRKTLIPNLDEIINYAELVKDVGQEYAIKPEIVLTEEYSSSDLAKIELETFGFYLSHNPIVEYKLRHTDIVDINNIETYFDKNINVIAYVDKTKIINTSKGDIMSFLNISDELTNIEAVMFPKIYEKYNWIQSGMFVFLNCKVEKRYDKYQLIVNEAVKLN